ncbi:hypothetical protein BGZ63DRAFT_388528 [Mariannaea sp. PMI_226]|nr:hypothetical protein BGZ63DRAFT_388528 [Mariannaea sp. PMI_226]
MDSSGSLPLAPLEPFAPAPYGRACVGCSRAKCKCFYRTDGSGCERCHRLGKACEQPAPVRKRRTKRQLPVRPAVSRNTLEDKLDDIAALLRSQVADKQSSADSAQTASSRSGTIPSTSDKPCDSSSSMFSSPNRDPDVVIDTTEGVVHLLRPAESLNDSPFDQYTTHSPIADDVSVHCIPDVEAEDQLNTFRRAFITLFPFVHLPLTIRASDLRRDKPFLWLVIMALTTKVVSKQYELAGTIWKIVSQRFVCEHHADLDLLLGLICFASWSHQFKLDKPFMNKLAQLAVSLGYDMDLHKDGPPLPTRHSQTAHVQAQQTTVEYSRTLEERRTFLALFQMTSSSWQAYRKAPPMAWTPYVSECVSILSEGSETHLDSVLAAQVKCHLITNQLSSPSSRESSGPAPLSRILFLALLGQLEDIRKSLPIALQSERTIQMYLKSTELRIRDAFLNGVATYGQQNGTQFQRLQDLESTLSSAERFFLVMSELPLSDWIGINVDNFNQLCHGFVVLFKLNTLNEVGWDVEEVAQRANVFDILDQYCEKAGEASIVTGIQETQGRRGILTKAIPILKTIKALMLAELQPSQPLVPDQNNTQAIEGDPLSGLFYDADISDDLIASLRQEQWLNDMMEYSWDLV